MNLASSLPNQIHPMFKLHSLIAVAAVLAAGFTVSNTQAATPDFSKLAGRYKATYVLSSGSTNLSGNVTVTVAVPKNGRKAVIQIVGFGTVSGSPGTTYSLLGNHTLTTRHKITSDNIILAYIAQIPALPTKFAGSGNKFTFTLVSNSSVATGTMSYTLTFNGKRLSVLGTGTLSSTPTSVVLTGKKQGQ
jgi:hypothetical protein